MYLVPWHCNPFCLAWGSLYWGADIWIRSKRIHKSLWGRGERPAPGRRSNGSTLEFMAIMNSVIWRRKDRSWRKTWFKCSSLSLVGSWGLINYLHSEMVKANLGFRKITLAIYRMHHRGRDLRKGNQWEGAFYAVFHVSKGRSGLEVPDQWDTAEGESSGFCDPLEFEGRRRKIGF